MTEARIRSFQKTILNYYRGHGRDFPWRRTRDPYRILVSEVMLQQTQTDRVVPKYKKFVRCFPTFRALARVPLHDVLAAWQGLGYNRRALSLHKLAKIITTKWRGILPPTRDILTELPGIGPGTAGAVLAFAFDEPVAFIETNIRAVFIHFFFPKQRKVSDDKILKLVDATLYTRDPRTWYYALMDYGAMLKKKFKNPSRRSTHHLQQPPFKGSHRQKRGVVLKALLASPQATPASLVRLTHLKKDEVRRCLSELQEEGFVREHKNAFNVAGTT